MSEEKRHFSRVPARLKGYARVMRDISSTPMFWGGTTQERPQQCDVFRNSKLPEDLTCFLSEMDRKLDQILGLLNQDTIRSDFPMDVEILEMSAAGVRFRTQQKLEVDTPLEIVILLNQVPLKMAGSKGRILGIDKKTGLYRFEFVDTRGSDLEAMVQFVFQQQREQIRNSKM